MKRSGMVYQNSVTVDDYQWFWSENCNALYTRNLETEEVRRVGEYADYKNAAYTKLVYYAQKLIALPYASDKVMIYDMKKEQFRYTEIGIPEMLGSGDNFEKFYGVVTKGKWLFMIGCKTAHILKFDMDAERAVGYVDLYGNLPQKENGIGYLRDGVVYEEKLLLPALYDNFIFIVDMDTLQYSMRKLDKRGDGFSTICSVGNQIWLFPFDEGEILRWNSENDTVIKNDIDDLVHFKKGSRNFLSAHLFDNKLWIIPRLADKVLLYDFAEEQFSDKNVVNSYFETENRELVGISDEALGENILFLTAATEHVIVFEPEKGKMSLINNELSDEDMLRLMWKSADRVVVSERDINMKNYLNFLKEM